MTAEDVVLALSNLGMAMMLGAFAAMASRGSLPRNGMAGIRIPSTMASDEAWVAGHRAATGWLWASAAVVGLGGVGALAAGLAGLGEGWVVAFGLGGMIGLLVPLLAGTVVAGRAATRVTQQGGSHEGA